MHLFFLALLCSYSYHINMQLWILVISYLVVGVCLDNIISLGIVNILNIKEILRVEFIAFVLVIIYNKKHVNQLDMIHLYMTASFIKK